MTTPKLLLFTDLDGTLLERRSYSFEPARPALGALRSRGIPCILTSSKTRAEIELYRGRLENNHPFISENGGAIFVPKDYFSFPFSSDRESREYDIIELGVPYPALLQALQAVKREVGVPIKGFSDFSPEELSAHCGFSRDEAALAKRREYDEPFLVEGGETEIERVRKGIERRGLTYTWGGRFHHLLGKNDKGKALQVLKELYKKEFSSVSTLAIGDSLNDLPMLVSVDRLILLGKDEHLSTKISSKKLTWFEGTGPRAWNDAVLHFLESLENGASEERPSPAGRAREQDG